MARKSTRFERRVQMRDRQRREHARALDFYNTDTQPNRENGKQSQ